MSALYEEDFYSWTQQQAQALRGAAASRPNGPLGLDWEHLAGEIEAVGSSLEDELFDRYVILIAYLLRWRFQSGFRSKSWQYPAASQRRAIARLFRKNPGLLTKADEGFAEAYELARLRAASETGFALAIFPEACPFSRELAEDAAFWPGEEVDP